MKTPKKVKIGTLQHHPRELIERGHYKNIDNAPAKQWVNDKYKPAWYEWVDSGVVGLLHGFYAESDEDGCRTVCGLVELPDGRFDTVAASCLKLETPTVI